MVNWFMMCHCQMCLWAMWGGRVDALPRSKDLCASCLVDISCDDLCGSWKSLSLDIYIYTSCFASMLMYNDAASIPLLHTSTTKYCFIVLPFPWFLLRSYVHDSVGFTHHCFPFLPTTSARPVPTFKKWMWTSIEFWSDFLRMQGSNFDADVAEEICGSFFLFKKFGMVFKAQKTNHETSSN